MFLRLMPQDAVEEDQGVWIKEINADREELVAQNGYVQSLIKKSSVSVA
jgi:hypothetical protein